MEAESRLPVLLGVLLIFTAVTAMDDIVQPAARGRDVVEAVCSVIEASCVFADDKLFTRRLAYIESNDGGQDKTFRPEDYGGIWQVDENMFNVTKSPAAASHLSSTVAGIKKAFNIDWSTVSWSDLTKPLYSAIGARLYLQYQSRNVPNGIPRSTADQAQFWVNYYRPSGNAAAFVKVAHVLSQDCVNSGSDIVFVLDSSGSIGSDNFVKVRNFVKDVIIAFDVGLNKTRFGVVVFDSSASRAFDLNTYDNMADMLAAVDRIPYTAGGTKTDVALDLMTSVSFTQEAGARPVDEGHPRIAIVLTDGMSYDGASAYRALTLAAAQRIHEANIIAFAIGVGTSLDENELTAIASKPTCTYKLLLDTGFNEIESLVSVIQKKACGAPIVLAPAEGFECRAPEAGEEWTAEMLEGKRISSTLAVGESQNCQLRVPSQGATVKLAVSHGAVEGDVVSFYTSTVTYPSEAFYDSRVDAWIGHQAVAYLPPVNTIVYCNYKSTGKTPTVVSMAMISGNKDLCRDAPCLNNGLCTDQSTTFVCECPATHTGVLCEQLVPEKRSSDADGEPSHIYSGLYLVLEIMAGDDAAHFRLVVGAVLGAILGAAVLHWVYHNCNRRSRTTHHLEFRTPGGLRVTVDKRDILTGKFDAIVCATNSRLEHQYGFAKAVADSAGTSLTQDCEAYIAELGGRDLNVGEVMHTRSGDLGPNIRHVIHVVGPAAAVFTDQNQLLTELVAAFYKCLIYANDTLSVTSVAIPAISAGTNGVDDTLVAEAAHGALMQFDRNNRPKILNETYFLDVREAPIKTFIMTFGELNLQGAGDVKTDSVAEVHR